jgi:hypothetical protein
MKCRLEIRRIDGLLGGVGGGGGGLRSEAGYQKKPLDGTL